MKTDDSIGLAVAGIGAVAASLALFSRRRGDDVSTGARVVLIDDANALARVITSEAHGYSREERLAIAWAVRNRARRRGVSIVRLVCSPACGPCCHGRPFSSARAGTPTDLELAIEVLTAEESADPTRGATAFFEPAVQDRLIAENARARVEGKAPPHPSYRRSAADVRGHWASGGQHLVESIGAFEFWT